MVPKRAGELVAGGSLYWVIRGQVSCREKILDIRPFTDKDGVGRCRVVLDGKLVLVEPRPRSAFQGWRYLADEGRAARSLARRARRVPHARDHAARIARTGPALTSGRHCCSRQAAVARFQARASWEAYHGKDIYRLPDPGDMNCSVSIAVDTRKELIEAATQHAVAVHGHTDSAELREQIGKMIQTQQ